MGACKVALIVRHFILTIVAMAKVIPGKSDVTMLTVTSKGQVTFRKDVLQHLGVAVGERLEVSKLPGGCVQVRAARKQGSIEDVFGILADKNGPRLTLEQIADAAAAGWAGRR
jgi:antitoxin PrlF